MDREGPGFLVDAFIMWITVMACLVTVDLLDRQFGRPLGLLVGAAAAVVIVFAVFLTYYRVFLDERPVFGTEQRSRFVVLAAQIVLLGFVIGAVIGPPDATTQALTAVAVIGIGVGIAYWVVYRHNVDEASMSTP